MNFSVESKGRSALLPSRVTQPCWFPESLRATGTSVFRLCLPSFSCCSLGKSGFSFQIKFHMNRGLQHVCKLDELISSFKEVRGSCQHADRYVTSHWRKKLPCHSGVEIHRLPCKCVLDVELHPCEP